MLIRKIVPVIMLLFSFSLYAQTAKLQVIHNSADPAAEEVDIYLNGNILLDDFAFRTATPFIDAPANTILNIGVAPGNSNDATDTLKNFQVNLTPDINYVAIANGVLNPDNFADNPDGESTAFTLFIKDMARLSSENPDNVEFVVLHGATDAPTVDVIARDVAKLVDDASYGAITPYIGVPASEYILDVTPGNDNSTIVGSFSANLNGLTGGTAVVFASGFLNPSGNQDGLSFGIFAALIDGTIVEFPLLTSARLQVIHNAADPGAEEVDVYLNGTLLLDNFSFREATPFIDAPAGSPINIGIAGPGSSTVADTLVNFSVLLNGGETYVAIANGVLNPADFASNPDGLNIGFTLFAKDEVREMAADNTNVEFIVVHGSTDAPTVDVIARNVATLVDNAAYGDITDYISVPAQGYIIDITPGNDNNTIVASFDVDLTGLDGGSAVVIASGFLNPADNQNGPAFGLIGVLADGTVVEFGTATSIEESEIAGVIENYELNQNYPNPFNPSTTISFAIPESEFVTLKVYNLIGQEVATLVNETMEQGRYTYNFDAANLASGIFFYKITAGNFSETRKMILTK